MDSLLLSEEKFLMSGKVRERDLFVLVADFLMLTSSKKSRTCRSFVAFFSSKGLVLLFDRNIKMEKLIESKVKIETLPILGRVLIANEHVNVGDILLKVFFIKS